MKNGVKPLKKLKLRAKMQHIVGQYVAIFKFGSGQFLTFISGNPATSILILFSLHRSV
jgi:hypothetical protein